MHRARVSREPAAMVQILVIFCTMAPSHGMRIEERLVRQATALESAPTAAAASKMLCEHGVARFDGVLDPVQCAALKSHITSLRETAEDPTMQRWNVWMGAADSRYVPGSRIRFASVLEEQLTAQRSDVMLPLEDALVGATRGSNPQASCCGRRCSASTARSAACSSPRDRIPPLRSPMRYAPPPPSCGAPCGRAAPHYQPILMASRVTMAPVAAASMAATTSHHLPAACRLPAPPLVLTPGPLVLSSQRRRRDGEPARDRDRRVRRSARRAGCLAPGTRYYLNPLLS